MPAPAGGDQGRGGARRRGDEEERADRGAGRRRGAPRVATARRRALPENPGHRRAGRRLRRGDARTGSLALRAQGRAEVTSAAPATPPRFWHRAEDGLLVAVLLAAMLLPLIDAVGRPFGGFHVPGGDAWLQKITLALAFLGGLLATREGAHLTLSTAELMGEGLRRRAALLLGSSIAAAVSAVLAWGAWQVILADRVEAKILPGGVPVWLAECVMPLALVLIALRFAWRAAARWPGRLAALAVAGGVFALGAFTGHAASLTWPLAFIVLAAALLGAPVFTAMGGLALAFFFAAGVPVSAVPAEIFRLIESPTLPAIPLLTACGYVLAES